MKSLVATLLVVAIAGCGSDGPRRPPGPRVQVRYSIDLDQAVDQLRVHPDDAVDDQRAAEAKAKALAQAVDTIRERIRTKGVADASVVADGEQIVVELPQPRAEQWESVRAVIARTGELVLELVDNDDAMMTLIADHVGIDATKDPDARAQGITAHVEQWQLEDGSIFTDRYLTAADREGATGREVLARYLRALALGEAMLRVPDDRRIGYQRIEREGPTVWRTYYLVRERQLTGADIAGADLVRSRDDHRPEILITFDDRGRERLAELTSRNVGRKVAIVIDDLVQSAPIVNGPITAGRLTMTMGGADPDRRARDARELVDVLRSGWLPAPLFEESIRELTPAPPP